MKLRKVTTKLSLSLSTKRRKWLLQRIWPVQVAVAFASAIFLGCGRNPSGEKHSRESPRAEARPNDLTIEEPSKQGGASAAESSAESVQVRDEPDAIAGDSLSRESCSECHREIVDSYSASGMSKSWLSATTTPAGSSSEANKVVDSVLGYVYRVSTEGGKISQVEERTDNSGHILRREALFLVGSGKHAQTMVAVDQGGLCLMPLAWYRHKNAWGLNPGYESNNRRFDRPVLPGCIACHGTTATHLAPSRNRFQLPIANGIGCERCHGDSRQHVQFWRTHTKDDTSETARMVHPGRFDTDRQNDLCMQCHLQGDVVLYRPGHDPLTFRPGDRLREQRYDLLAKTTKTTQLGVGSHGSRMLQSRCYIASQGKMTCIMCHDPHRPVSDFSSSYFDAKCATCHQADDCSRGDSNSIANNQTSCVVCHMPQRSSREGVHLVFTDHAIVKRPPDSSAGVNVATTLKPNDEVTLVSCWPNHELLPATLGAAYVHFHDTMSPQLPSVQRAVGLLEETLKLNAGDVESQYWLGSAHVALGNGAKALQSLTEVVQHQPQRHVARFRLGLALELTKDYARALPLYEQLIREIPFWVEPYPRLTQLYLFKQDAASAARIAQQQLHYQQDALAYAQLALAHRLNDGSLTESLQHIRRAIQLDPLLPTAYLNRAVISLLSDQNAAALTDFQYVLKLDPQNVQARQAIDALLKQRK